MIDYKEEYEKLTKQCGVCGESGEVPYNVQHGNSDEYHTEFDVCPTCNGTGRVVRMMVSEEFVDTIFEGDYEGQWEWKYPQGISKGLIHVIEHFEDKDEIVRFKLTRMPDGMWEISEVTE